MLSGMNRILYCIFFSWLYFLLFFNHKIKLSGDCNSSFLVKEEIHLRDVKVQIISCPLGTSHIKHCPWINSENTWMGITFLAFQGGRNNPASAAKEKGDAANKHKAELYSLGEKGVCRTEWIDGGRSGGRWKNTESERFFTVNSKLCFVDGDILQINLNFSFCQIHSLPDSNKLETHSCFA